MALALALHSQTQALHQLMAGGLRMEVSWVVNPDGGQAGGHDARWNEVAATKSFEESVGVELVLRSNCDCCVQLLLHGDNLLMQTVDRSSAQWVEACAIAACSVRLQDALGRVRAQFFFCR
jgi:hypothetical protein